MKKIVTLTMVALFLLGMFTFNVSAQENVSVYIDGTKIEFDVQPQIINGRTLVPMRKIFEELGAVVDWDNTTQTAIGTKGSTTIKIAINDYTLYKNGIPNVLDVPAQLIESRTLVPIRAISESFGCKVDWDGNTSSVYIATNTSNFNKVSSYLKNNGTYMDEHYSIKGGNILLSYAEKENLISLYQIEDGQYEVILIISEHGDVTYRYIDIKASVQMEGIFTAATLTDDRNNLPYFSYNGSSQIESLINEQATLATKMSIMTTDIVLYSNNSNCSTSDLGFVALSNLSTDDTEKNTDKTSSNGKVPTYSKFPMVPDWGLVLGDMLIQEFEQDGGCMYIYTVTKDSKELLVYMDAMEKSGYIKQNTSFAQTIEGDKWSGLKWKHSDKSYPWVGFLMSENDSDPRTIVFISYAENEDNKNEKRILEIEELIDEANDAIKDIKADIKSFKKEISNIEADIDDLEETLNNASQEKTVRVLTENGWVWEADSRLTRPIEDAIEELEIDLEFYEDLLDEAESTLEELEDLKDELEDELETLQ